MLDLDPFHSVTWSSWSRANVIILPQNWIYLEWWVKNQIRNHLKPAPTQFLDINSLCWTSNPDRVYFWFAGPLKNTQNNQFCHEKRGKKPSLSPTYWKITEIVWIRIRKKILLTAFEMTRWGWWNLNGLRVSQWSLPLKIDGSEDKKW